ncbi:MAG: potassium-transporting ATPase subunit C [Hamadaea sp.]|uniref:potassium-transporting ATPase subunit C n=1 Tax=Hamadaea sp. TaxID=2024425 RepID=UPI00181ED9A3|nr:potassium-transporting ATPase subunit C [Hamadaea sp.]NUR74191.1 potassium-transporting ATPase subunit C [Hamadaea sp.]NUT20485.1 potassium-transporting ATPase subunit C [Hamadaea sp.]
MRLPSWITQHIAALRTILTFTVLCGIAYPLIVTAVAQLPGLRDRANGSVVTANGKPVGSAIIGQLFTDDQGDALKQYFQSRPSAAGDGYDLDSTSASNLGPESIEDKLSPDGATLSLLSQVCSRSKAVGELEGVDGRRPYCTSDGLGAVLRVFHSDGLTGRVTRVVSVNQACPATPFVSSYAGVAVECAKAGEDYSGGVLTTVRGDAPAESAVPADAVTASASGLDPQISPEYAKLQVARVAQARGVSAAEVLKLVEQNTTGRALGFLGEPGVNVLQLNLDLDAKYPYQG